MAAFVYEGVLLFGVLMGAALIYSPATHQTHALQGRNGLQAFVFFVLASYFIGLWTHGGQTLAMRSWRLRLVDLHGQPVSVRRAALRYVLAWLWFLPALLLVWRVGLSSRAQVLGFLLLGCLAWALASLLRADRQFWHDAWAGTRLIESSP